MNITLCVLGDCQAVASSFTHQSTKIGKNVLLLVSLNPSSQVLISLWTNIKYKHHLKNAAFLCRCKSVLTNNNLTGGEVVIVTQYFVRPAAWTSPLWRNKQTAGVLLLLPKREPLLYFLQDIFLWERCRACAHSNLLPTIFSHAATSRNKFLPPATLICVCSSNQIVTLTTPETKVWSWAAGQHPLKCRTLVEGEERLLNKIKLKLQSRWLISGQD